MKERPIIFNTEMIKAILSGNKQMTRRVIKIPDGYTITPTGNPETYAVIKMGDGIDSSIPVDRLNNISCPYGQAGDSLWVRETWQIHDLTYDCLFYKASEKNGDPQSSCHAGQAEYYWRLLRLGLRGRRK